MNLVSNVIIATMAIIFDGRTFAADKEEALILKVLALRQKSITPHLVSIIVGEDPASHLYVSLKKKAVERLGGEATIVSLNQNVSLDKVLEVIKFYNNDPEVHGIMIQLPLPGTLTNSKSQILNSIDSKKDVDGLREDTKFLHPTSKAVVDIIDFANGGLDMSEKLEVVVVGATGMVGAPVVKELKEKGYKVIGCDSKTEDLKGKVLQADIVVSATGQPKLITEDMIKKDAIVVDVGSPVGDCDLDIKSKASFITPVPGGVGPVTISCLLENLIDAASKIS